MSIVLRDNTEVGDVRLGRLVDFDALSWNYPVRAVVEGKKPRSYTWRCHLSLNQGDTGMCVGTGLMHDRAARPAEVKGITLEDARNTYWEAQKIDPWAGGEYPGATPRYEGTSVLAGVKVEQQMGWFDSYRWAFGLYELILGVGYNGPAVIGVNWYTGMFYPDLTTGIIRPTGQNQGGHCVLVNKVDVKRQLFGIHNSWGTGWGLGGNCLISFEDMDLLLHENGEAVFPQKRHLKGP